LFENQNQKFEIHQKQTRIRNASIQTDYEMNCIEFELNGYDVYLCLFKVIFHLFDFVISF